ncbi:MAG: hypothetical protein KAI64_06185 [Thermoplasmata archaeon]|nr:hypothetical protein [Thermoplasmata archaeon]
MTEKCGRDSNGHILWPGRELMPMCSHHKNGPLQLAKMMGWSVLFVVGEAGPCESLDPHPDDEGVEND